MKQNDESIAEVRKLRPMKIKRISQFYEKSSRV